MDRFKRYVKHKVPLTSAQRFPLALIKGSPQSSSPFFEDVQGEPISGESILVQAPEWTRHDYMHTPFEAFTTLSSYAIVHLEPPHLCFYLLVKILGCHKW
ncbi:hypothetical protein AAZX31_02G157300 [Glycine max]